MLMSLSGRQREIVQSLIETKAVDFDAIGRAVSEFGPTAALDYDYEPIFCGTNRFYVHIVQLPWPTPDGGDGGPVISQQ
jgi:hypothetical protein